MTKRRKKLSQAEQDRRLLFKAITSIERVAKAQSSSFKAQAEAMTRQMDILSSYLKLFTVTEPPTGRVIRDEDEYRAELARMEAEGYPTTASLPDQYRFILNSMTE